MERSDLAREYRRAVFAIVSGFFLFGCGLFVLVSVAAIADATLGLGWHYTWQQVPLGVTASIGCYGGYWLTRRIRILID